MTHKLDSMKVRRNIGIFAMTLLFLVVSASLVFAANAETPVVEELQLRTNIMVDTDQITLGDLFRNSGDVADRFIAASPNPGRRLSLHPAAVGRIITATGRVWQNPSGLRRILVERSGHRLGKTEITEYLRSALFQQGITDKFDLVISAGSSGLFVPDTAGIGPYIEHVDLNASSGNFTAILIPYEGAKDVLLRGRAWPLTDVPGLKRPVSTGQVIRADDIQWISVRTNRLNGQPIMSEDDMIGLAAKRPLAPAKALRLGDLKIPDAVKKGELITILYEVPGLKLTARGKVLASAGTGETVRAVNLQSSRTIDVTIVGPGQAIAVPAQTVGG